MNDMHDFDFHTVQPNTAGYPIDPPDYDSTDSNYDNHDFRTTDDIPDNIH